MPNFQTIPVPATDDPAVRFLYGTRPGRLLLKLCTRVFVSKLAGAVLNGRISAFRIGSFVRRHGIDMEDYEAVSYRSFNEFFVRKLKPGRRPVSDRPEDLIAPCDGKLSAYPITDRCSFDIKHQSYSVGELIGDDALAAAFVGGAALIFRLVPTDYHRYCFVEDGEITEHKTIPGVLHTVRPIAHEHFNVYGRNSRECTVVRTRRGHDLVQVEVGAMLVGRIVNHKRAGAVRRGEEKGMFEFGGSTVALLLPENAAAPDPVLFSNTRQGLESVVKQGETIGRWINIK